jgi:hypothetical protein
MKKLSSTGSDLLGIQHFWQQDVQNKFGLQSDSAVTDLGFQRAMVQAFAQFPTYYVLYKDMSDETFVSQLYVNLQNRSADAGGLGYWVGRINGSIEGTDGPDSREKVTADFIYGTLSADYGSDAFVNNFDAPTLAAAQAAQDAARNKIEVAKYYTQVFGALSNYGDIVGSGYFNPNPASPTYEADAPWHGPVRSLKHHDPFFSLAPRSPQRAPHLHPQRLRLRAAPGTDCPAPRPRAQRLAPARRPRHAPRGPHLP